MMNIEEKLIALATTYAQTLKLKIDQRIAEIEQDDDSHYLIYQVLGITSENGKKIDVYQNKGRFLYKYAGAFMEEASILCFEEKFERIGKKVRIPNTQGTKPKTFEIDCLVGNVAYEIKWRDATTDGDHIVKEHTRVQNIREAGYKPVRIMFYYPNRSQAMQIQEKLQKIYVEAEGACYFGNAAWNFIKAETDVDLLSILKNIATRRVKSDFSLGELLC